MAFAAIHIPHFLLQAAVRTHPQLRASLAGPGEKHENDDVPVAVTEGAAPLERVAAANAAAAARGIAPGMLRSQVEELREGVVFLRRSPALEQAAHAALLDLGWSCSPRLEESAFDTVLLDLSGLAPLFGSDRRIAERLIEGAAALHLSAQVAVAANPDAAFYAARGYPGITLIPAGEEAAGLAPLPLAVLAPAQRHSDGCGLYLEPAMRRDSIAILESWGLRTCAALAGLPPLELSERLGADGIRLHELARGAGSRALILAEPQTNFEEAMELDDAVAELEPLLFILGRLLDQLCARLESRALAASAIHVSFSLELSCDLPESGEKAPQENEAGGAWRKTMSLPVPLRDSKLLLTLLRLQLESAPPPRAIREVTLSATPAAPRGTQGGLFSPAAPQPEKLELTIARLAHLVGSGKVGAAEIVDTHRPGEFRVVPFAVTRQPALRDRRKAVASSAPGGRGSLQTALRNFRPPVPARVEVCQGRPARLAFRGRCGKVLAAAGPWRTSGAWWEVGCWQCDEWDVEVEFPPEGEAAALPLRPEPEAPPADGPEKQDRPRGIYRIFFDALRRSWFVRGAYD